MAVKLRLSDESGNPLGASGRASAQQVYLPVRRRKFNQSAFILAEAGGKFNVAAERQDAGFFPDLISKLLAVTAVNEGLAAARL